MNDPTLVFRVTDDASGQRLDRYLQSLVPDRTRSTLTRWIKQRRVDVDGVPAAKPGLELREGMELRVRIPPPAESSPAPESIPIGLLYEDEALAVVDKPAGMVVHPGHGNASGTLVNALLGRGIALASAPGPDRPGIVHRLDAGTSGVLVVAKTDEAHRRLASAFARRSIDKRYMALVWGRPREEQATIRRSIGRSREDRVKMTTGGSAGRRREAISEYRTLELLPGFTLLEVHPRTGRTHQIRVHMQSIHHPIVGDDRYGGRPWRGVQDPKKRKALREFDRLALHAIDLEFDHPTSGERVAFHAPLPADLQQLFSILRSPS